MKDSNQFDHILQRMNFKHIDLLLENAHFQSTQSDKLSLSTHFDEESGLSRDRGNGGEKKLTFIHEIAILFENNCFTSLGEINFK